MRNLQTVKFFLFPITLFLIFSHFSSIPYETWLEHSRYMKILADNELQDTYKLRESLFICRERARNDMRAQRDCTDFTLRKRIFETQKSRNELQWLQFQVNVTIILEDKILI